MRVSREEAKASKDRIIQKAAQLMREKGISATSIADVMTAAGMTTGGFYKHFKSKDDLASAAIAAAFDSILAPLQRTAETSGSARARAAYLRHYLSEAHVRNPGKGCPVAAMGIDGGREAKILGPDFKRGIEATLNLLGADETSKAERAALIRKMAALVGAVILARAVGEGELRQEILVAAAQSLVNTPQ
jgi:TetR/AcrR family transcriptional repressor of nem operon